eukprot:364416-Chlamydomonas_euryale.AAC.9
MTVPVARSTGSFRCRPAMHVLLRRFAAWYCGKICARYKESPHLAPLIDPSAARFSDIKSQWATPPPSWRPRFFKSRHQTYRRPTGRDRNRDAPTMRMHSIAPPSRRAAAAQRRVGVSSNSSHASDVSGARPAAPPRRRPVEPVSGRRRVAPRAGVCPAAGTVGNAGMRGACAASCSSASSSAWGARRGLSSASAAGLCLGRGRSDGLRVNALFEKFTERSIKSVMIAQQEAKWLGASEVGKGGGTGAGQQGKAGGAGQRQQWPRHANLGAA